ncbi:thioesterase II family protein [Streptomyces fuscichromogenes]|uniref:Thioesterase n=1 Tax=Streptomyces fuscichromogenes TaxID=1324013 RepID=A0A917XP36_9ACTN|nr:alpha/beta fold hydrolase [Streptomyces fuscichromogenes]GGN42446.1 thioesterase [Streptomyces fuscichromogenes]
MKPIRLVCLPFAGAGASFFREWTPLLPEGMDILPVQLPGREERFAEPLLTDVESAADEAAAQVTDGLEGAAQVVVFGHSLGAVLAFELARRLADTGTPLCGLFVSGSPGPWSGRAQRATGLDDDAFLASIRGFAGYTHPALEIPEMRELLLPLLRADVEMHENYRPRSAEPLTVPVTSVRGRDDELVTAAQAAGWAEATRGGFTTAELDGGHMYLTTEAAGLLARIGEAAGTAASR